MIEAYVIVSHHGLEYVGVHESSDDAWRIFLGWPTKGEVREKLSQGWYCTKATLMWREPE